MKKQLLLLRGFIRCNIFHFCPKCNSTAPEIDTCNICDNYRDFPKHFTLHNWWIKYKKQINEQFIKSNS